MNCIVDSNPQADIVWVFDPIDRVSDNCQIRETHKCFSLITTDNDFTPILDKFPATRGGHVIYTKFSCIK